MEITHEEQLEILKLIMFRKDEIENRIKENEDDPRFWSVTAKDYPTELKLLEKLYEKFKFEGEE